jgi:glyoxylase-like metal-dependent hydrolase (beta-lactamase superfamily II)/rhodanese-related sulfurtransferase
MLFQQFRAGGCLSYLIGCERSHAAALIDPEISLLERYVGEAGAAGLRLEYLVDTHTHADHFSATHTLAQRLSIPVVMYRSTEVSHVDMRVDEGEELRLGDLRLEVMHTPGHTSDSMCLVAADRVVTGDTLLIQSTGRTDLPTGDPVAMHASLFERILALDDRLQVYPAHDYKGRSSTTIGEERASNPRLQLRDVDAFVAQMRSLSLSMPVHLTEALRVNRTGGKSVAQMIEEATRAVPFMSMHELGRRLQEGPRDLTVLDVRERDAYDASHLPGALHLARGQLELRIDGVLPDPTTRLVVYCELGMISTLAVATLRAMGYLRAVALDGGLAAWRDAGLPLVSSARQPQAAERTA